MKTTKCIVWQKLDGSISITHPAENSSLQRQASSEQEWLDLLADNAKLSPRLVTATRLPDMEVIDLPERRFRNCWRKDIQGKILVDVPLARAQRMAEIRQIRNKALVESDGLMARANEIGTAGQIDVLKAYRQTLRDIPQVIDLEVITTPEALDTFEPAWPKEPQ